MAAMDTTASNALAARLAAVAAATESLLGRLLADEALPGEIVRPSRLLGAMRCSAAASGCARSCWWRPPRCSAPRDGALLAGAALECLHCYSLVHDDLPAMDDDDLRRGRPTVHKAFDQATAILAGDALLTIAFDAMSRAEVHPDPAVRIALVSELARAAGLGGIADDLLDVEGDTATIGKTAGKDAAAGKATLVAALGPTGARAHLDALVAEADAALAPFAAKADTLRATARFIAERRT
jgi:farnesyl diphosphate synthase